MFVVFILKRNISLYAHIGQLFLLEMAENPIDDLAYM